jgi:hypothetical protein
MAYIRIKATPENGLVSDYYGSDTPSPIGPGRDEPPKADAEAKPKLAPKTSPKTPD